MFEWLKNKYKEYKLYSHIGKQHCFVFPILPKNQLVDGASYETFDLSHQRIWKDDWHTQYKTKTGQWCAEKDCFIDLSAVNLQILSYEEFKPLRKCYQHKVEINYGICSYNPCDVNALDLEELKKITFDLNDDNTESDEVWERFITYFDDRGIK